MSDDYIRLCLLLHSLQLEVAAILNAVEAGELATDRAFDNARSLLSETLRTLAV
jgi:hypothetical protein